MMRAMFAAIAGLRNHITFMDVVGNNIANVNTPNFTATRVEFEGSLARALDRGDGSTVAIDRAAGTPWGSLNGNQVSLEEETATLVKSGLHYEAIVNAVNTRMSMLSTAIGR